ncbi:MAG TPA: LysR family transcriptional regulator [Stellaceae bacterium]|jgi:DNA-binding transcriptional LysR family regulator|nr:LysR family transcriptional regulator [Stellaceae bacterium]
MKLADRIERRIKLRDLNVLIALAHHGSMAKAARHLATSQSVVSKAVADLERILNVRLFDRDAHGVELTMYGRALLDRGIAVFDELKQGALDIEFLADPTVGEVRIGCTDWIEAGLVSVVIEKLSRKYPRIVFHVGHAHTATTDYRDLRDRSFDLVIARIPSPFNEKDLDAEILFDEPIFVVAGSNSKWARRRKIALAELIDEPWLLTPPNTLPRSLVEEAFNAHGLAVPTPSAISYTYHLRNSLVALGRYLTIVPGSMLYFNVAKLPIKALPIPMPIRPRPVAVIKLKRRILSPAAMLFIEATREIAEPLTKK